MMDLENMTGHRKMWWERMLAKYGSEEKVRAVVSSGGKIGGPAKGPKGLGSPKVSLKKKTEIRRMAVEARKKL